MSWSVRPWKTALVSIVLVAVLAGAACGRADRAPETSTGDRRQEALLAVAQCMRDRGIDVPDPEPGDRGLGFARSKDDPDRELGEVREACHEELGGTYEELEPESRSMEDRLVDLARCMRDRGIDMPDPDFSGDEGIGRYIRDNADFGDPEWEEADAACRTEVFGGEEEGPGGGVGPGGEDG